jgi:hypothetical protein
MEKVLCRDRGSIGPLEALAQVKGPGLAVFAHLPPLCGAGGWLPVGVEGREPEEEIREDGLLQSQIVSMGVEGFRLATVSKPQYHVRVGSCSMREHPNGQEKAR